MNNTPSFTADSWSLDRPNARRSLILCILGALLGLAIAGVGLFTAKGTRTSSIPPENVALVNQVPILRSDYIQQLRALYDVSLSEATLGQKKVALDGMIREELYVQRGVELGLQADTIEVREALVGAVESLSAADATMAQPSERDLRDHYTRRISQFETVGMMELSDYVLPRDTDARAVAAAAQTLRAVGLNGADVQGLARRSDRMRDGEEYYFAARIHLGSRLFAIARSLKPGAVSAPVTMNDGIHLLVMKTNVPPVPQPYDEVRDQVLGSYTAAQTKTLTGANERFLRKRADIQIAKGFE